MKTVLIVGSDYYGSNEKISNALKTLGYNTNIVTTYLGINKEDYIVRIKNKIGLSIDKYKKEKIDSEGKKIQDAVKAKKPDFLIVRSGVQITADKIKELSKITTTILLLGDALSRYPQIISYIDAYDYAFTFEPNDIPTLQKYTSKPIYLFNGSYSETIFFKKPDIVKDIDVSFIGSMYSFRRELLERLADDCKDLSMVFYGKYTKDYQLIKRASIKKANSPFMDCDLPYQSANTLYNRSKICLNLQHPQSEMGWNSRLAEILGSGSFEIVTENPAIVQEFQGAVETYANYDELLEKIRYYLLHTDERDKIAQLGHEKAERELTTIKSFKRFVDIFDS